MAINTNLKIYLNTDADQREFESAINHLRQKIGSKEMTISTSLDRIQAKAASLLKDGMDSVTVEALEELNSDVNTIIIKGSKIIRYGQEIYTEGKLGYLCLLVNIVTDHLLKRRGFAIESNLTLLQKIGRYSKDAYQNLEFLFANGIQQDPYARPLRTRVFKSLLEYSMKAPDQQLFPEEVLFHIERKNTKARQFGGTFNGKLIVNHESENMVKMDLNCIKKLHTEMQSIKSGKEPRTQFIVFVCGNNGHVIPFDVAYNQKDKQFEIICIESASQKLQYDCLNALIPIMEENSEKFQIVALQCRIQKNKQGCSVYSIALANESSKLSFSELKNYKPQLQKTEQDGIVFYNNAGKDPSLKDLSSLKNVTWVPVAALGLKAILMGQSTSEIKQRLEQIKHPKMDDTMQNWFKAFDVNQEKQKSYFNYHEFSLKQKFLKTPFQGLTVESVFEKVRAKQGEEVNEDLALRRLAAGFGPYREMEFLVLELEKRNELKRLDTPGGTKSKSRTPLHLAIINGNVSRACLLVSKGAKTDIPDDDKKTAKDYFENSTFKLMAQNLYLKQQFG